MKWVFHEEKPSKGVDLLIRLCLNLLPLKILITRRCVFNGMILITLIAGAILYIAGSPPFKLIEKKDQVLPPALDQT